MGPVPPMLLGRAGSRLAIAALALCGLAGCSPSVSHVAMRALVRDLSQQYHDCVPLGWNPVPVAQRYYYPGYTAEYREEGVWLHPAWLGFMQFNQLADPSARTAYLLLDALVRAGLVAKSRLSHGFYYRLTMSAMPFYFEDDNFRDNPDRLPYLCYSRIVPTRVRKISVLASGSVRVTFDWMVVPIGTWADNQFLRKHTVVLPPVSSPAVAVLSNGAEGLYVSKIRTSSAMLPATVDPAVWPPAL